MTNIKDSKYWKEHIDFISNILKTDKYANPGLWVPKLEYAKKALLRCDMK